MAKRTRKAHLGSYLSWHGAKIRVTVRVPPSLRDQLGHHLRETLNTDSPAIAEVLKYPVIAKFKAMIAAERHGTPDDPLLQEALAWRTDLRKEADGSDGRHSGISEALEQRVKELEQVESEGRTMMLWAVATGQATPINSFLDAWLRDNQVAPRTAAAYRHGVGLLERWCEATDTPATLEQITPRVAVRFVEEVFKARHVDPGTANKAITGLSSYWTWLIESHHLDREAFKDTWKGRRLPKRKTHLSGEDLGKRPFTNEEAAKLLQATDAALMSDICRVAALSGMRLSEISELRVRSASDGFWRVGRKTKAARRDVPIHPDLTAIVEGRTTGKDANDFLFHELPEQRNGGRSRGAPISQAFTRLRRDHEVDDRTGGVRQSRIDFHSWRRWFIRSAIEALEEGAVGFTAWTIADVVGHSKEDGPLPMTMGLYPGKAGGMALRACVEAVKLPIVG